MKEVIFKSIVGRIRLVKPDKAAQIEQQLMIIIQTGKIIGQMTDQQLITTIQDMGLTLDNEPKITVDLKRFRINMLNLMKRILT